MRPILIGESWREGAGEPFISRNPADGSVNDELSTPSPDEIGEAVETAAVAAASAQWRDLKTQDRARCLYRIAEAIEAQGEHLAQTQMRDNGKTIGECRGQAAGAAGIFRYYAAVCETSESEVTPQRGEALAMTVYEPVGVVAAITPWNSPLTMEAQKLAPALAAGNAVILKPSEVTPLVGLEIGRICREAGLPPGVVNVISGPGAAVGETLLRQPGVNMVSFTGGTATGRRIAALAAERFLPVALELGGKSPHIVFADAPRERAIDSVAGGIFGSLGQSCVAGSRVFVEAPAFEAVVEGLVARAEALRLGPPADEASEAGPLASFEHRETVERYVALGLEEGGRLRCGGARPEGEPFDVGAYYRPTVLTGLRNEARACQEEIFGPVACVLAFDDEDDLIAQANDTVYGLACGIWTEDYRRAWRLARAIDAGTVWINTYRQLSIATPFGGFKQSGLGREKGRHGMRLYMEEKSLYWNMGD